MRYITSTELQNWHNTRQSEEKLPLLLRRVIVNLLEFKNINFIDITGGDSIWKPGADCKIIPKIEVIFYISKKSIHLKYFLLEWEYFQE